MSKRTEEAALKAYPNIKQPVWGKSYPNTLFVRHTERNAFIKGYEQAEKDLPFTHIEPTDDEKMAAVHYMEDCQEVDDFVRRGIDGIAERYFVAGVKWERAKNNP